MPTNPLKNYIRNEPVIQEFQRLSARTGTPLSSLFLSAAIIGRVLLPIPLVGVYFGARAVGGSDKVVKLLPADWVNEGEEYAAEIGTYFGWFGYKKWKRSDSVKAKTTRLPLEGDVANIVLACAATKASLFPFHSVQSNFLLGTLPSEVRSCALPRPSVFEASNQSRSDADLARVPRKDKRDEGHERAMMH